MDNRVTVGQKNFDPSFVIDRLEPRLTAERVGRMKEVVGLRDSGVMVVTENLYDRGNVSAVMRSAEAFGFYQFTIIESGTRFKVANRTTQGADKWLQIQKQVSTKSTISDLKMRGYRILASSLKAERPLAEINVQGPVAIVLGNEKDGITDELAEQADELYKIPMKGFSQSFNISVAAALSFYELSSQRHKSAKEFDHQLYAQYLVRSVEKPECYLRD